MYAYSMCVYVCIYIYIYIYTLMHVYIYTYIKVRRAGARTSGKLAIIYYGPIEYDYSIS